MNRSIEQRNECPEGRHAVGQVVAITVALALAALALVAESSGLDRWVLDRFHDPVSGGFPLSHGALQTVHNVQTWAVVAFGLLLLPSRRVRRGAASYLLACIAVTTLGVAALKHVSPVECPWSLHEFGGIEMFKPAFAFAPASHAGHCSPGAHSSGAFALIGLFVLLRKRQHLAAWPVLGAVAALGSSFAVCQWARGAHFPSHDLWTACIAWSAACALQPLLMRRVRSQPMAPSMLPTATALLMAVLVLPLSARAQAGPISTALPVITDIEFRGNETTLDTVMRREIAIAVGDAADPAVIERSRQAIQDLGLFREVKATTEPHDVGQRVVFTVREKWYLIGYPRLSANTDGQNALGAELRWNNVLGRNHSLRALASSADNRDEGRGRETKLRASYHAPFLFGSPYGLELSGSHLSTPVEDAASPYDELVAEFQVLGTRHYGLEGAASQGWNLGAGLKWRNEDVDGEGAPAPWGDTYALVLRGGFRNVRDHLYSETGTEYELAYEIADQHVGSDYSYSNLTAEFKRSIALGSRAHQTFEYSAALGSSNNGPFGRSDYTLGGTNGLRGYDRDRFEGDFYYLLTAAYLHPIHWDWLRFVATLEAGNVFAGADAMNTEIHTSLELGVRVRVPRLVNFEFELGYAFPLDDDSGRIYGSRNGF